MDFIGDGNWPLLIVAVAALFIVLGLIRKLVKLAFIGVALAVLGFVLWPMVSGG